MTEVAYLASAVGFIVGLKLLGAPRTARTGNRIAATGMLAAIVTALVSNDIVGWWTVVAGLVVGAALGAWFALRVQMTAMPELVAAFNGFGGIASALVAAVAVVQSDLDAFAPETSVSILFSIVIGSVTFTVSFVAFGKLQGHHPWPPHCLSRSAHLQRSARSGAGGRVDLGRRHRGGGWVLGSSPESHS